jgi:hypothetical protein
MPNAFAYLVFYSWPIVVMLLFWKLPMPRALVVSILGGYLFLPERVGLDLPILPTLDKTLMPSLVAGIMCLVMTRKRVVPVRRSAAGWPAPPMPAPEPTATDAMVRTGRGQLLFRLLFVFLFLTPVLTVLQNAEPVITGSGRFIPGLRPYDIGSLMLSLGVTFLPFFLAQRFLARPEDQVMLLQTFVIAGLGYSLLCLYEIRMSPQLNNRIYGFFPHSFFQHIRAGGFRPIVFLPHGLWVGIFLAMTIMATAAMFLWSKRNGKGGMALACLAAVIWLLGTLFLSKAVGAMALALIFVPVVLFLGVQGQLMFAMIVAGITLFYPLLRGAGWIPVDTVYEFTLERSADRAQSLKFRLDNEDLLLARAAEKPVVGWGSWGRNLTYSATSGDQETTPDGAWIILIGTSGWVGYILHFGLLTAPLFLLGISRRKLGLSVESSGLAMVLAINLLDLIPNATLTPLTYLVAGALAGRYAMAAASVPDRAAAVPIAPKPGPAAWPQPAGIALRQRQPRAGVVAGLAGAPEGADPAIRAAGSRKHRQPRRGPE